jgi:hypothetical protein
MIGCYKVAIELLWNLQHNLEWCVKCLYESTLIVVFRLLRQLDTDLAQVKKDLLDEKEQREQANNTIKNGIKNAIEKLQGDLKQVQEDLEAEQTFSRGLANWIKNNLGPNLELVQQLLDKRFTEEIKQLETQQKEREEGKMIVCVD